MDLDRRELLATAGALALGGLAGARPALALPGATAQTAPHRVIDLGLAATLRPGSAHDLRVGANRALLAETGTEWVRLWADWPSLQPDPALAPDDPASPGRPWLQALDEQIELACRDGVAVLLVAHRFPLWATGLEALAPLRDTDAEIGFAPADRTTRERWERYLAGGRDPSRARPSRRALEERAPPEGCGPGSAWARFFAFLYARYHLGQRASGRFASAFELVNEPNLQLWPQRGPSPTDDPFEPGELVAHRVVAGMQVSARAIAAAHGPATLLLAPSAADTDLTGRTATPFDEFALALLDELDRRGHRALATEGWAHHNYLDVEERGERRLQRLRAVLDGRWGGVQGEGGPSVFVTEGGARLRRMRALYPQEDPLLAQAECLRRAPRAGMAMLAQYTTYADPRFDCGLLGPWPEGRRRPAVDAWAALGTPVPSAP